MLGIIFASLYRTFRSASLIVGIWYDQHALVVVIRSARDASNTDANPAEIFASLRKDNLDLSGVAVLEPQLTLLPQIEPSGMMHMTGFFPSVPSQVNFDLLYAPVNRQWRHFRLGRPERPGRARPARPNPAGGKPQQQDLAGADRRCRRAEAGPEGQIVVRQTPDLTAS
jgi:hypothetical protein